MPYYVPAPLAPAPVAREIENRNIEYPDIVTWCRYLDSHAGRNRDGIQFAPFGEKLKAKGFLRLHTIDRDLFSATDLASWLDLGDQVGTAITLMHYAKKDIELIKTGQLFLPSLTNT